MADDAVGSGIPLSETVASGHLVLGCYEAGDDFIWWEIDSSDKERTYADLLKLAGGMVGYIIMRAGLAHPQNFDAIDDAIEIVKTGALHVVDMGLQGRAKMMKVDDE